MITSAEILNRVFPSGTEPVQPEVLGGYPDFSYGAATEYFSALNPDERALVQHYAESGIIPPYGVETYVTDFARGYTVVDPHRSSTEGVLSATVELGRIEGYVDAFLKTDDYFPRIGLANISVFDENGIRTGDIDTLGWQFFTSNPSDLAHFRKRAEETKVFIGIVKEFIEDPKHDRLGLFSPSQIREHIESQRTDTEE